MNDTIIKPEEVFDSLLGGFEVIMIQKNKINKYGISSIRLSEQRYDAIEAIVSQGDDPNRIFVKTEKYEEEVDEDANK